MAENCRDIRLFDHFPCTGRAIRNGKKKGYVFRQVGGNDSHKGVVLKYSRSARGHAPPTGTRKEARGSANTIELNRHTTCMAIRGTVMRLISLVFPRPPEALNKSKKENFLFRRIVSLNNVLFFWAPLPSPRAFLFFFSPHFSSFFFFRFFSFLSLFLFRFSLHVV